MLKIMTLISKMINLVSKKMNLLLRMINLYFLILKLFDVFPIFISYFRISKDLFKRDNRPTESRFEQNFEIISILGQGGFGTVFKCTPKAYRGKKEVVYAVKKIPFGSDPYTNRLLLNEVRTLARFQHKNIVEYFTAWIETSSVSHPEPRTLSPFASIASCSSFYQNSSAPMGHLYIQMEYCEGFTLRDLIDNGALQENRKLILVILKQLAEGLKYIHDIGKMHRDLKPSNVFVVSSAPDATKVKLTNLLIKIGDFGLATDVQSQVGGEVHPGVGTALYMAPEQEKTSQYNEKVDIYALGIILAEMLLPPFSTSMGREKCLRRFSKKRVLPKAIRSQISQPLQSLLASLVAPSPEDRPPPVEILCKPFYLPEIEDLEILFSLKANLSPKMVEQLTNCFFQRQYFSWNRENAIRIQMLKYYPIIAGFEDSWRNIFHRQGLLEIILPLFCIPSDSETLYFFGNSDQLALRSSLFSAISQHEPWKECSEVVKRFSFGDIYNHHKFENTTTCIASRRAVIEFSIPGKEMYNFLASRSFTVSQFDSFLSPIVADCLIQTARAINRVLMPPMKDCSVLVIHCDVLFDALLHEHFDMTILEAASLRNLLLQKGPIYKAADVNSVFFIFDSVRRADHAVRNVAAKGILALLQSESLEALVENIQNLLERKPNLLTFTKSKKTRVQRQEDKKAEKEIERNKHLNLKKNANRSSKKDKREKTRKSFIEEKQQDNKESNSQPKQPIAARDFKSPYQIFRSARMEIERKSKLCFHSPYLLQKLKRLVSLLKQGIKIFGIPLQIEFDFQESKRTDISIGFSFDYFLKNNGKSIQVAEAGHHENAVGIPRKKIYFGFCSEIKTINLLKPFEIVEITGVGKKKNLKKKRKKNQKTRKAERKKQLKNSKKNHDEVVFAGSSDFGVFTNLFLMKLLLLKFGIFVGNIEMSIDIILI
eukprot:GHVP01041536.1.p1 GENE.GHVP01041536.1~~GHVP01041536.1.p1  ORF type:complete len:939 (+),score=197.33 GHVP01041536.1:905-3721(+)